MSGFELFFKELFGYNPILATILISMLPATEARLGIPFGMNAAIWGSYALSPLASLLCGFVGSSLVVPVIALLFKPVLNWAKKIKGINKIFFALENKLNIEKNNLTNNNEIVYEKKQSKNKWKLMFGVFFFVLTPLPLTGVYTGTMLGCLLNLGFFNNCIAVILGNFFACLLISGVSSLINTTYVMIAVLVSLVVILISRLIKKRLAK